jgi:protein-S-isoprenylcysteine O-methyltransferase Ste14
MIPPVCFLVSVIAMICLAIFIPGRSVVPFPWNLVGLLPFGAGAVLSIVVDRVYGKNAAARDAPDATHSLITTGIFRFSRHPMYLAHLLMLVGLAICLGVLIPLLVVPVFLLFLQVLCVAAEERALKERFGESWSRYRREVRRWL